MAMFKVPKLILDYFRHKSAFQLCAKSVFAFLCLAAISAMVPVQLREWLTSKTVFVSFYVARNQRDSPKLSNGNNNRNSPDPGKEMTTKTTPPTCEFPQVNVYETSVMKVADLKKKTIHCEGIYLPDLTYNTEDNKLKVNKSKVLEYMNIRDFQHCRYRHIFPVELDDANYTYSEWSVPFTDFITIPPYADFLKVECTNKQSEIISKTFYSLFSRKEQFEEKDSLNFRKLELNSARKEILNIVMIGMGSLSRNQFIRAYNQTYSYLMNTLKSFDLAMHSQIGNRLSPNMWPLFAGYSQEVVKKRNSSYSSTKNIDLIWRKFEKSGYSTLFTEDNPTNGVFRYLSKYSPYSSVMHDMRPLTMAMYSNKDMYKRNYYCSGNQLDLNRHLDYVRTYLDVFHDKPVLAVAMLTRPTLTEATSANMFDEHLLNFYKLLNQNNHLSRSVIVSFSGYGGQHGTLRNSANGHVESKTPYTILTFPDWFLIKYPDVAENLQQNTKRLTSHFDTHATLLDLLYFSGNTPPWRDPHDDNPPSHMFGVSLLKAVPRNRTCLGALIPADVCLCGYTYLEDVYVTSQLGVMLAKVLIKSLNSKTDKNRCVIFKLERIIRIQKIALDDYNSKGTRGTFAYHVKLEVKPGKAIFAATVFEVNQFNEWKVGNDIGRLNSYSGQSECVEFQKYRPLCYCKDWLLEDSSRQNNTQ